MTFEYAIYYENQKLYRLMKNVFFPYDLFLIWLRDNVFSPCFIYGYSSRK